MNRKASVLFVGSPYWSRHLAHLLNRYDVLDSYTTRHMMAWMRTEERSICFVGLGQPDTLKRFLMHVAASVLEKTGLVKRRVIYWIGSDVMRLRNGSRFVKSCTNIAGSSWLCEEVRSKGYICSERLFPVEISVDSVLPFPESSVLKVLCYIPDADHQHHGSTEIRALVERRTDIEFDVIGGTGNWWPGHPSHIHFHGWISDPVEYLRRAHVVLRRTEHDSFSAFVREGLVAGRHVIFTYAVPGVVYVEHGDIDRLASEVDRLNKLFLQKRLAPSKLEPDSKKLLSDVGAQLSTLAKDYG